MPYSLRKDWFSICHETIKKVIPHFLSKELERWRDPTTPPINAMLLALKTATEAYLETPLNTTDLVTSTVLSKSNCHLLELELDRLGLRRTEGGFYFALEAAILANDRTRDHPYFSDIDETRLLLAVDYSRSALTTGLFIDENGVLDIHRFIQDIEIGADASPSHLPWSKELELKRRRLLREVASLPVTDAGFELPATISELVLIGDRAKDDELLKLLEEIVGTGLVTRIRNTTQYDSVDPIFTAVKSIAARGKYRIDEGGESCLSWDCKRSWMNYFTL